MQFRCSIPHYSLQEESWLILLCPRYSLLTDKFELRREKRKQTNRESARRSRLRKQHGFILNGLFFSNFYHIFEDSLVFSIVSSVVVGYLTIHKSVFRCISFVQ
ncbi:hypothetical protein DCAR_0519706 [Daucus carota subsp. sativus]|uniref:BZIP domain-containing protein n=1 Tax=Daucus carota subsp. sativus TaxID=79200 RepID=A0AAF0X4L2_DAUCS|nr:hypothetical protein DCAR_0519706 [Daucus carota subsp. sativus]